MIASLAGFYHPGSQIYDLYDLIKKALLHGSCRSWSPSAAPAWKRTTRQSGAGSSATVPNWRRGCAVISSQPTNLGVSMRPTFVSRAVGATSTEPSIPPRRHDRLRALGAARCRYGPTPAPQSTDGSVPSTAPGYQYGPSTPLWGGDFRSEAGRNPATPLPSPADPILEQHPGAGSSSD